MRVKEQLKYVAQAAFSNLKAFLRLESNDIQPELSLSKEIAPYQRAGFLILAVFLAVGFFWGVLAPIEGAAVASGKVVVSTNRKKVQHLEGGIVAAIHVKEGDVVETGQPLVDLMDTKAESRHLTIEYNLIASYARVARLVAERDNKQTLSFDWPEVSPEVAARIPELRKQEMEIITYRRNEVMLKRRTLDQQIQQHKNDVAGLKKQKRNLQSKLKLSRDRLNIAQKLRKDQLFSQDEYLTLQMQQTEYKGQLEQVETQVQNLEEEIKSKRIAYEDVLNQYQKMVVEELQRANEELQTYREQRRELGDVLGRTQIKASQAGIINGMKVTNIGQVIAPGEVLMEIVPQDDSLIIEARVKPQDIDSVYIGQKAKIILVPYRTRYMPKIMAELQTISADAFLDERTNENYYTARLTIEKKYLDLLEDVQLYPGMPTEVFLVTRSRSMFAYLLDPIRQSFRHAFREE